MSDLRQIHLGDCLDVLRPLPDATAQLVYIDPPFNTGVAQSHTPLRTTGDTDGDRTGFGGRRYRTERGDTHAYDDAFDDYEAFLVPRLVELWRVLDAQGALFVHLDAREVHYVKVWLDRLVGRERFVNEIIWAYDYGGRSTNRWPAKHDTLLWYVKDPKSYTFNFDEIDRIPYLAPSLVGDEKAARGKTPTDVWWHTIVPTSGSERTGYPTQKPLGILNRIVRVHSKPGDLIVDAFAGSGTSAEAAARTGRQFLAIDRNPEAVALMARRLAFARPTCVGFEPPQATGQLPLV